MGRSKVSDMNKRKTYSLTFTGEFHATVLPKLNEMTAREHTTISTLVEKFLVQYARDHSDGNPNYTMDDFADPHFLATPALMRDKKTISKYLTQIKGTEQWPQIEKKLNEWVKTFNLVDKK